MPMNATMASGASPSPRTGLRAIESPAGRTRLHEASRKRVVFSKACRHGHVNRCHHVCSTCVTPVFSIARRVKRRSPAGSTRRMWRMESPRIEKRFATRLLLEGRLLGCACKHTTPRRVRGSICAHIKGRGNDGLSRAFRACSAKRISECAVGFQRFIHVGLIDHFPRRMHREHRRQSR